MAKQQNKQNTNNPAAAGRNMANAVNAAKPAGGAKPTAGDGGGESFITKYAQVLILAGVGLLTFLFYRTCIDNKLTNWDDLGYIINNSLIKDTSDDAIKNIFSRDHPVMGNFHPLTILLYYFEYQHSGLEPGLYHLDSILLHILTTFSVYLFVKVLTRRTIAAAVVALLFGLHPMHVESVAWAAGRKDVLYSLFFMLSLTTYVFYLRSEGSKRIVWYVAGIVLFALSLLSKSVAVTLPVTLFAIDYLEKRKLSLIWVVEKLPHFGLSLLFGIWSVKAQDNVGAMTLDVHFGVIERAALGCYALCTYLWKAVVPAGMTNFYPYPLQVAGALPAVFYGYLVAVLGIIAAILILARKNRTILFGAAFFLINIVLLLQFIPVGGAIISDRYGYLPYLGLFFIAGWYVSEYFEHKEKVATGKIVLGAVVAYSLILGYVTNERCKDWSDSVTLWRDNIEKHPEAPVGYFYLGQEYFTRYEASHNPAEKKALGDSSLANFNLSVARKPDYINPIICIAELQRNYGQIDAARKTYYQALKISDKNESVYLGLGVVYAIARQYDSSEYAFKKAISIKPFLPEGYSNYANFLDIVGRTDSSLAMYKIAIAQNPDAYIPYMNRGKILYRLKRYDEAIKDQTMAVEKAAVISLEPGEAYYIRARSYAEKGNKAQALADLNKAKSLGYAQIEPGLMERLR